MASKIAMGPMRILTPFRVGYLGRRAHVAFSWASREFTCLGKEMVIGLGRRVL